MTERTPYSFAVLRYVHDTVTGEFVNVGILLHAQASTRVHVKLRATIGRLREVFPDLDRSAFKSAIKSVERSIAKVNRDLGAEGLFREERDAGVLARLAIPADDSSLQWSSVGTGITDDPERALERLYVRMVARYDISNRQRRTDEEVWRPVRDKLAQLRVPVQLQEKVVVGLADQIAFKHAWKNGVWHAYEPISLDLADSDGIKDKARRWLGHLSAVADGNVEQLRLHFIVGAPQDPALRPAYQKAIAILEKAPFAAEVYEESDVDTLVARIEDEVRQHSSAQS